MDKAPTLRRSLLRRGEARPRRLLPAEAARFWREAALLLVALALLNGSNFVLHVVLSRLLGPAEYGALAALLAVLMVLSVPFGVVQTVVATRAAALRGAERHDEAPELAPGTTKALGAVTVSWLGFEGLYQDFPRQGAGVHLAAVPFFLIAGRLRLQGGIER